MNCKAGGTGVFAALLVCGVGSMALGGPSFPKPSAGVVQAGEAPVDEERVSPRLVSVLPVAGGWLRSLDGLQSLKLKFNEPVYAPSQSVRAFVGGAVPQAVSLTVTPNSAGNELLVTLNNAVNADLVTLIIDYSITDLSGNPLDGELNSTENTTFPSGDGFAGGQAVLRFNVLEGDVNKDGVVDGNDLGLILDAFDTFNPQADLNGNGIVDSDDVGAIINNFGGMLTLDDGNHPSVVSVTPDPTLPLTAAVSQVKVKFSSLSRWPWPTRARSF
ncbi:MAG: GC-type dockerin domain-anchored protein [Phycisphaerales bacterium]